MLQRLDEFSSERARVFHGLSDSERLSGAGREYLNERWIAVWMGGLFAPAELLAERKQEHGPVSLLAELGVVDEIHYFAPPHCHWYSSRGGAVVAPFQLNYEDQKDAAADAVQRQRSRDADGTALPALSRAELLTMCLAAVMPLLRQPFAKLVLCGYSFGAHVWSSLYPLVKQLVRHHHLGSQRDLYTNDKLLLVHMASALVFPFSPAPSASNVRLGPAWSQRWLAETMPAVADELRTINGTAGYPLVLKAMRATMRPPDDLDLDDWCEHIDGSILPRYQPPDVCRQFVFDRNVHIVCAAEDQFFPVDGYFPNPMPLPPLPELNLVDPVAADDPAKGVRPLINATFAHLFRPDVAEALGGAELVMQPHRTSSARCHLYIMPGNHVAMVTNRLDALATLFRHIFRDRQSSVTPSSDHQVVSRL